MKTRLPIVWYEWLYEVSNLWEVKSLWRKSYQKVKWNIREHIYSQKILKKYDSTCWYYEIGLYKDWVRKRFWIHRLVAIAFLWEHPFLKEINHIDGDKKNNNVLNLEWVTRSDNMLHASKNKLLKTSFVEQYTKKWEFIKRYFGTKEASRQTLIWQWNIRSASRWKIPSAWWYIRKHT